jgi:hypothetical protein
MCVSLLRRQQHQQSGLLYRRKRGGGIDGGTHAHRVAVKRMVPVVLCVCMTKYLTDNIFLYVYIYMDNSNNSNIPNNSIVPNLKFSRLRRRIGYNQMPSALGKLKVRSWNVGFDRDMRVAPHVNKYQRQNFINEHRGIPRIISSHDYPKHDKFHDDVMKWKNIVGEGRCEKPSVVYSIIEHFLGEVFTAFNKSVGKHIKQREGIYNPWGDNLEKMQMSFSRHLFDALQEEIKNKLKLTLKQHEANRSHAAKLNDWLHSIKSITPEQLQNLHALNTEMKAELKTKPKLPSPVCNMSQLEKLARVYLMDEDPVKKPSLEMRNHMKNVRREFMYNLVVRWAKDTWPDFTVNKLKGHFKEVNIEYYKNFWHYHEMPKTWIWDTTKQDLYVILRRIVAAEIYGL